MQLTSLDPRFPVPTTSGTGTPITAAYDSGWSRDSFLEVTGPATAGGPIPYAFASKEAAFAAAASLSHGAQPALAVLFDATAGASGSKPWVVQAVQMANPDATGFVKRNGEWMHTGWRVDTGSLNLETGNLAQTFRDFVSGAPFTGGVEAIIDGAVLIPTGAR